MAIRQKVQSNTNSTFTGLELKSGPSGGRMHDTGVFLVTKGLMGKHYGDDITVLTVCMNTGYMSLAGSLRDEGTQKYVITTTSLKLCLYWLVLQLHILTL